jgi:hypothetical protein
MSRQDRLLKKKAQKNRAIALVVVGSVLTLAGIAITIDGFENPRDGYLSDGSGNYNGVNYLEWWLGPTGIIVGITLWIPGAVSWASSQKSIVELSRPEPAVPSPAMPPGPAVPGQPSALLFQSPVFRF